MSNTVSHDLDALKADWQLFKAVTGIERPGPHHRSFLRDERHGSLSTWEDGAGAIRWRDHGTDDGGSVIDAAILLWNCTTAEAIRQLSEMSGHTLGQNGHNGQKTQQSLRSVHSGRSVHASATQEPVPPKANRERLDTFMAAARRHALEGHPEAIRYAKERGVDLTMAAELYGVGFVPEARFPEWPTWRIRNAWALPIMGPDGVPVAVKLHCEDPPPGQPKCLWAPFGTEPANKNLVLAGLVVVLLMIIVSVLAFPEGSRLRSFFKR